MMIELKRHSRAADRGAVKAGLGLDHDLRRSVLLHGWLQDSVSKTLHPLGRIISFPAYLPPTKFEALKMHRTANVRGQGTSSGKKSDRRLTATRMKDSHGRWASPEQVRASARRVTAPRYAPGGESEDEDGKGDANNTDGSRSPSPTMGWRHNGWLVEA